MKDTSLDIWQCQELAVGRLKEMGGKDFLKTRYKLSESDIEEGKDLDTLLDLALDVDNWEFQMVEIDSRKQEMEVWLEAHEEFDSHLKGLITVSLETGDVIRTEVLST